MRYYAFIFTLIFFPFGMLSAQFQLLNIDFKQEQKDLRFPLTGGFTNAQFNNCDLNRDGNNDVVVFDRDGGVIRCFVYNTNENRLEYRPEYNSNFPELNNFLLIRDYNGDGVEDLFTYSHIPGISGVQVLKGYLENGELAFERVTFPNHRDIIEYKTRNGNFVNAYVSSIDQPAIEDIDRDGDMDLLSFEPGGSYIYYYKNTAAENGYSLDSLTFVLEDNCWGKIYEAETNEELELSDDPNECAFNFRQDDTPVNTRHAGSTLTALDINGDELMDLLIGDLASPNIVALYNGGTLNKAYGTSQETMFPQNDVIIDFPVFLATFYVDIDNDDINELIVAPNTQNAARNQNNIWLYENEVIPDVGLNPAFIQSNFLLDETLDLSGSSVPAITDVNQDGLLDIVVGTNGFQDQTGQIEPRVFLFTNIGTQTEPAYQLTDDDYLGLSAYTGNQYFAFAPSFGDLDNDGDEDLIMGNFTGSIFYFENIAGPGQPYQFDQEIVDYLDIDVGQFSVPQIVDVNEDGLPDLLIGERNGNSLGAGACGNINYFENIGSPDNPDFNPDEDQSPNTPCFGEVFTRDENDITGFSSPQLIHFQEKDWLLSGSEVLDALLYKQEGGVFEPFELIRSQWGSVKEGRRTHPRLADLNGDGKFEMIIGNSRGGLAIYGTNATSDGELTAIDNPISDDINLFPNPGHDQFMIQSETLRKWDIKVYNISGKLMLDASSSAQVNTGELLPGIYFVHLSSAKGHKIMKWIKH